MTFVLSSEDHTLLGALSSRFPTADSAAAEVAALKASLDLPKGTIHVVSDVHGEYKKLRHIINNASGHIRPLVDELFADRLSEDERRQLLALIYYPGEATRHMTAQLSDPAERRIWVRRTLRQQFEIIRALTRPYRRSHVQALIPIERRELFEELLLEQCGARETFFVDAMVDQLAEYDRDLSAVRAASRLIRNLSVSEIIVAGDLGDRGPRVDRVIDFLLQQPKVSVAWGNHDMNWMGACVGNEALIATVMRISLRYRRLSQLEEGYGLIVAPLEKLARDIYGDDPAVHFKTKGTGLRDDLLMAQMQKAISVIQFKLEGQAIQRHPEWEMDHRNLLHRMDLNAKTIDIQGKIYPLRDSHFPTFDPANPYELSPEEKTCMKRLRESFVSSARLWEHMSFLTRRGAMWLRRDETVIFHGCVPVDDAGEPLSLVVDGKPRRGRELFDALDSVVRRTFRKGSESHIHDLDWLWYLWTGPISPLFGKDRMATLESYLVEDKEAKKEHKNAYFKLIHDAGFCDRVLAEFGVASGGLIVNGHVPVKVEKGEAPVKNGGNAVTIDGAFSEAYGDRGYTLILEPERVAIAEHHHFESVAEAIISGADIIPKVTTVKEYHPPRKIRDTEDGVLVQQHIAALQKLIAAYEEGVLLETKRREAVI